MDVAPQMFAAATDNFIQTYTIDRVPQLSLKISRNHLPMYQITFDPSGFVLAVVSNKVGVFDSSTLGIAYSLQMNKTEQPIGVKFDQSGESILVLTKSGKIIDFAKPE